MKKSDKYAKNGAIILGLGNGVHNAFNQWKKMNSDPDSKFNWLEFFQAIGAGALVGGSAGYTIGWYMDHKNSKEKPLDLDRYLIGLADKLMLDKSDSEFIMLQRSVNKIVTELKRYFGKKINGDLIPHGSTEKGTALHSSFDIDLAVPFRPKSFANNEVMYHEVHDFFEKKLGTLNIVDVRMQKRSVGVCLRVNHNGYWVDFAPYKLSKVNKTAGYLYVNKQGLLIDNSTIQKTDLSKLNHKFSSSQKKIIVILKDWKERNDLPLPSHFLEYLILDAYSVNRSYVPKKLSEKMIMVLKHLADHLHVISIRGKENTNNMISQAISSQEKQIIIDACTKSIEEYRYQPNSLTRIFK